MLQLLQGSGPLGLPILLIGAFAIVFAIRFAARPDRRLFFQCLGATALTNIAALLSAILGYQRSVAGVSRSEGLDRGLVLLGVSESLNAVVIALALSVVVVAIATVGAMRSKDLRSLNGSPASASAA